MNTILADQDPLAGASSAEVMEDLFADLVARPTNLAMMFMGPESAFRSGQAIMDLDAVRMLFDQLEMLKTKTFGNLSPRRRNSSSSRN